MNNIFFLIQTTLPYIVRKIFEIQHKLYQQQSRLCSTGRLQEAFKVEEEQEFPKINDIKQDASAFYYPVQKPFKHDADIGEQFTVSFEFKSQLDIHFCDLPTEFNNFLLNFFFNIRKFRDGAQN